MQKKYKSIVFYVLIGIGIVSSTLAQETLKSAEEEYYDFLAMQGLIERPTLNYRTLSDSVWIPTSTEEATGNQSGNPWQHNNLGTIRNLTDRITMKIYGPELFTSFNSAAPYGQNDGVLWQGRGLNASLIGGIRFEGYGLEVTVKPQFSFSQNMNFELMQSAYDNQYGYFWSYGNNNGVDAPQRFGDSAFFDWSFGDTEIRYTWKTLTIGFGTQNIWLGPSYINPILHSNNAAPYPKLDVGLRRTRVTIPGIEWYIGDIEARIWTGFLSESEYFDSDSTNDHNMFHGLALSYAPSFLPGLVVSANRTCLVKWKWENFKYVVPLPENTHVGESGTGEDQKMSLAASWSFPKVGFEVYGELGIDDFASGRWRRYPFSTSIYTVGLKKNIAVSEKHSIYGQIVFEHNWFELPLVRAAENGLYAFNFHYQIIQGYTNNGQYLGSALANGGNSQYLGFKLYFPKGSANIFFQRVNPDNTYLLATYDSSRIEHQNMSANITIGISGVYFITKTIQLGGGISYTEMINPLNAPLFNTGSPNQRWHNINCNLKLKYCY